MIIHSRVAVRRGTVIPLFAISITGLLICMALAIDIGMMAVTNAQLQVAADNGAMAGARALTGDQTTNNNYTGAQTAAQTAAQANIVMGQNVVQSTSDIAIGVYYYDTTYAYTDNTNTSQTGHFFDSTNTTTNTGGTVIPADRNGNAFATTQSWNLVKVTTRAQQPTFFSSMIGYAPGKSSATASACHRPRDIAIVLDYSPSMSYGSQGSWNYSGNANRNGGTGSGDGVSSLNADTNFPQFGHWSAYSPTANTSGMHSTVNYVRGDTGEVYVANNWTVASNYTGPAVIGDFYTLGTASNTPTSSTTDSSFSAAFTSQPTSGSISDYCKQTGSYSYDKWAFCKNNPSLWAATVQDIVGSTSKNTNWETSGYASISGHAALTPYTVGPGYYGISFYIWPPDPTKDWRSTYFTGVTTNVGGTNYPDNTKMFNSSGIWSSPTPNYTAILSWIANSPVQVFPPNLYSGHICYYKSIPTTINDSGSDSTDLQLDKAFWKAYIDYVLTNNSTMAYGTQENDYANTQNPNTGGGGTPNNVSFSTYFGTNYSGNNTSPGISAPPGNGQYMNYQDNPVRPKLGFWFGGLSMMYFILDSNGWWPGTAHQAHSWHLKAGMNAVLDDIKTNHPNDQFSVINFAGTSTWTQSVVAMGQNYQAAKDVLFFPYSLLMANNSTISSSWGAGSYERPYSASTNNVTLSGCSTTQNSATITVGSTSGLAVGMPISGSGISSNPTTTIQSINSGTSITLSTDATGTHSNVTLTVGSNYACNSTYQAGTDVPSPTGSTCPQSGFAIAFNELSSASGYNGRKGAAKLVIFETDGYPTYYCNATTYTSPATPWKYTANNVGSGSTSDTSGSQTYPGSSMGNALAIAKQIVASDTATQPGYSTARTLARVHSVAFGDDFDTNVNAATNSHLVTSAKAFLLQVQKDGYTSNPTDTDIQSWKYITGTASTRITEIGTCFTNIMQSGVKVVLIR